MTLQTALLFGLGTALPLVVGAAIGAFWNPPQRFAAELLAFARGALMVGLAFELFEPAVEAVGLSQTTVSLGVGTSLYVALKYELVANRESAGFALLAGVLADGIAENLTLGAALVGTGGTGALAILAGIAANNLPEALGGADSMVEGGRSATTTTIVWVVTATVLTLVVVFGYVFLSDVDQSVLALVRTFGAGAVLATLTDEIMPDAYREGGPTVAFATAAGFVVTFIFN